MKKYRAELSIVLNILLAASLLFSRDISIVYSLLIVLFGLYKINKKKNADGAAHMFAGYVVGVEVLLRMNSGGLVYEFGKYATLLFLTFGLIVERRKLVTPVAFVAFILLLIPSVFMVSMDNFDYFRQNISYNITGPIMLGLSVIYFYKRKITPAQLRKLFLCILSPIVAMSIFLYFRSGSLEGVDYTTESNFLTSGGFGPNQVSTLLGLGVLIIAASYFMGIKLFRINHLNIVILLLLMVRGLATFSRGGILAPIMAILLCVIIMTSLDYSFKQRMSRAVYAFLILSVIALVGFNYVNDVSGGMLEKRFKGESQYDKEKSNLLSGRDEIFMDDLEVFMANPMMGVGPGMAAEIRSEGSEESVSAHIEYSRLLAEHGALGLIAVAILLIFPVTNFFKMKSTNSRILLILCVVFALFTMGHAAMRLAAAGFMYGLGFINLVRPIRQ